MCVPEIIQTIKHSKKNVDQKFINQYTIPSITTHYFEPNQVAVTLRKLVIRDHGKEKGEKLFASFSSHPSRNKATKEMICQMIDERVLIAGQ